MYKGQRPREHMRHLYDERYSKDRIIINEGLLNEKKFKKNRNRIGRNITFIPHSEIHDIMMQSREDLLGADTYESAKLKIKNMEDFYYSAEANTQEGRKIRANIMELVRMSGEEAFIDMRHEIDITKKNELKKIGMLYGQKVRDMILNYNR